MTDSQKGDQMTHLHAQALLRFRFVSCPYSPRVSSTRRLGQLLSLRRFYASVYDNNFLSLVTSLFSWRCLAASIFSSLHAAINLRLPSVTVLFHAFPSNVVAFQSPVFCQTPGCRSVRCRTTFFPCRSTLSALHPQDFSNMNFFGNRPPLNRMSSAAHKSLLVHTLSQCTYIGLSRGHGCTRSSDSLVSCAVPR